MHTLYMDMMLGQNTAHYRYIYLYICIFYSLQFSFLLWRMKNSHLVVINKVEIKTTVNTHFLQEVSTDISSYPELVFFFFFFISLFLMKELSYLWVGCDIDSRKLMYCLKTILCIIPSFPF